MWCSVVHLECPTCFDALCFLPRILLSSGRGAGEHHRAGLPGQAVPDRCRSGEDHEDEEDSQPQPSGVRTLQPAQVSCEGTVLATHLLVGHFIAF